MKKTITASPGERTEIEIPGDDDSPLPFESKEIVVVVNPEEYIPLEQMPIPLYEAVPEYPDVPIKDGLEGVVRIKAYVDETGTVRTAQVVDCSHPDVGFEEAALDAAYKNRYRPAIQQNNAVGVWITYSVKFSLDDK
jgi:TonB family protein